MCKLRDVVVFAAGAVFFHTVSHVMLPYVFNLPIDMKYFILTPHMNVWIIIISAILTVALLWWAHNLKK